MWGCVLKKKKLAYQDFPCHLTINVCVSFEEMLLSSSCVNNLQPKNLLFVCCIASCCHIFWVLAELYQYIFRAQKAIAYNLPINGFTIKTSITVQQLFELSLMIFPMLLYMTLKFHRKFPLWIA